MFLIAVVMIMVKSYKTRMSIGIEKRIVKLIMGIGPPHFTDLFGRVVIWKSHPCGLTSWEHYGNPIPPFFQWPNPKRLVECNGSIPFKCNGSIHRSIPFAPNFWYFMLFWLKSLGDSYVQIARFPGLPPWALDEPTQGQPRSRRAGVSRPAQQTCSDAASGTYGCR
jgi:hypothetical protein